MLKKTSFDNYDVYDNDNTEYVFIDINLKDEDSFYDQMFEYFFSEEKLLRYCENRKNIKFKPSRKSYTLLYRQLKNFIDERKEIDIPKYEREIEEILCVEGIVSYKDGERIARKDKIGKIGEYMFSCLLMDYFKFDCIIPKIHLQTDYNMSVYGIDTLFYSEKENMILFGESKFSVSLSNGIKLIKKSLKDYEKQISDEYELVLCNRLYNDKLNKFKDIYGEYTEICINVEEFIKEASISKIGIPIFIAHGTDIEPEEIIKELKKLPKQKIFGIDATYYCISLPVMDKYKTVAMFMKKIKEREKLYCEAREKEYTAV